MDNRKYNSMQRRLGELCLECAERRKSQTEQAEEKATPPIDENNPWIDWLDEGVGG